MVSIIKSLYNYMFAQNEDDCQNDDEKEEYLAQELLDLELSERKQWNQTENDTTSEIPRNASCFQRTGIITYIDGDNLFIDGLYYFDKSICSISVNVKDKILYLGYENENNSIVVVRILQNYGIYWEDENEQETADEVKFDVIDHKIIGEVDYREDRNVFIKDNDLKFNLDDVEGTFVPISGDWLELTCTVQVDEDKPTDVTANQVVKVLSFKSLRTKVSSATITAWNEDHGICSGNIFFNKQCLPPGLLPVIGMLVLVEAIESNQGYCAWRVIKMIVNENSNSNEDIPESDSIETSQAIENEHQLDVTYPIVFEKIHMNETSIVMLEIVNKGEQIQKINKWIVVGKKRDSQICISPVLVRPYRLYPGQTFVLNIKCQPKHYGNSKEKLIIMFQGFKIERTIDIHVMNDNVNQYYGKAKPIFNESTKIELMKKVRDGSSYVPGVRPVKPPNFIPVRIGGFPIPDKIWAVVIGDSQQVVQTYDFEKIMFRIEDKFPFLTQELNIRNYLDKWHTLLYMEEIQENLNIRVFDMSKAYLIRCQEYLSLEINGLSEKRPSLVEGDRVIVHDAWDRNNTKYEGYIHSVKGDIIMMKFNKRFHEQYTGSDVSVEFHFSRMKYRRSHQALNLALSNLGPEVLFPSRITYREPRIPQETLNNLKWFNDILNDGQKAAVRNILSGESRPKPYCIYGPPGTGKTVTVVETILQILCNFPDSRILVSTPSNSAANLITQRLIKYKNSISGSFVRILANYLLDSDTIPNEIKPYCVTLDIAREGTTKPNQSVLDSGININVQKSYVGRHRITIGTCFCLGSLTQMGFPKGHFTHVVVDEAGQATEPEIMIPLSFIDKDNGQIVLAGDPMQLGPVILSRYCKEFGLDESYLSRILETFPYQKDYQAYKNGYNEKLVTLLTDNYRSLQEVINLPSILFYDNALVPKIYRNKKWINEMLSAVAEIYHMDNKSGGIFVYGIRGCNTRAEDSPSWFNPQEASMLALTVCKLYKNHISANDIGIITPYIAQTRYLRTLFASMGLPLAKIGTVEEFQGQERRIILISTVRSSVSQLDGDYKSTLGFVKNAKRFNVALTRAQVAVLLFCDPHLLSVDPLWHKVIDVAVKEDKYMGCDLPRKYEQIIAE